MGVDDEADLPRNPHYVWSDSLQEATVRFIEEESSEVVIYKVPSSQNLAGTEVAITVNLFAGVSSNRSLAKDSVRCEIVAVQAATPTAAVEVSNVVVVESAIESFEESTPTAPATAIVPPTPLPPATFVTYTCEQHGFPRIQKGDNLWRIATMARYGNTTGLGSDMFILAEINNRYAEQHRVFDYIDNVRELQVGSCIYRPQEHEIITARNARQTGLPEEDVCNIALRQDMSVMQVSSAENLQALTDAIITAANANAAIESFTEIDSISSLCNETAQIAVTNRMVTGTEMASCNARGVNPIPLRIGRSGVALIAHPNRNINTFPSDQLFRLLNGQPVRWDVLIPDEFPELVGISIPAAFDPAQRVLLEALQMSQMSPNYVGLAQFAEQTIATVATNEFYIGLISYEDVSAKQVAAQGLQVLEIDNVPPLAKSIFNGDYLLSSHIYLHVATKPQTLEYRPQIETFVGCYLREIHSQMETFNLFPPTEEEFAASIDRFRAAFSSEP